MTRHPEELDELIDRVASAMTMAPTDPTLADRVARKIETAAPPMFGWPRLAMGALAIGAVALVAMTMSTKAPMSPDRPAVAGAPSTGAPAGSMSDRVTAAPIVAVNQESHAMPSPRRARRAAPRYFREIPEFPQIDALSSPALLALDDLPTDALTIAPVDFAPLDLANLAIGEVPGRADPKE